jgi:hypothetical protein
LQCLIAVSCSLFICAATGCSRFRSPQDKEWSFRFFPIGLSSLLSPSPQRSTLFVQSTLHDTSRVCCSTRVLQLRIGGVCSPFPRHGDLGTGPYMQTKEAQGDTDALFLRKPRLLVMTQMKPSSQTDVVALLGIIL